MSATPDSISANKPPANLNPGLNEIMDVFEEIPQTFSKYLTLWKEIDCKCNQTSPKLKQYVHNLLSNLDSEDNKIMSIEEYYSKLKTLGEKEGEEFSEKFLKKVVECNNDLNNVNFALEELMPSIEENLHVSTIALDQISQSVQRLELAYETCLKNGEIPKALRLGKNNHPAMHLHYELMEKASKDTMNALIQTYGNPIIPLNEVLRTGQTETNQNKTSSSNGLQFTHAETEIGVSGLSNTRAAAQREQQVRMAAMQKQLEAMGHVGALDKKKKTNTSTPPTVSGKKRGRIVSEPPAESSEKPKAKKTKKRVNLTTSLVGTASGNVDEIKTNGSSEGESVEPLAKKKRTASHNEETYCICEQIAYGEMIACDNKNCPYEWFHLQCVGLTKLPSNNKWYCPHCKKK
ncbi:hypothetical protein QEN19_004231 [Hanseniaspora menglaensis]